MYHWDQILGSSELKTDVSWLAGYNWTNSRVIQKNLNLNLSNLVTHMMWNVKCLFDVKWSGIIVETTSQSYFQFEENGNL